MTRACKIAVSLPQEDYEKLEEARKERGVGRSAILDEALRFWLTSQEQQKLVQRYENGYREKPEKVRDLKALEETEREVLEEEDWESS